MADLTNLRVSTTNTVPTETIPSYVCTTAADVLADILKDTPITLPNEAQDVELLCTHLRPHLDEYMGVLLFRSCLNASKHTLPLEETVINNATHDNMVLEHWNHAAVFGMGGVQNGGAHPLLLFDEHVHPGKNQHAFSSVALVVQTLFGKRPLPKSLFTLIREIDLIDGCGGAHPKHLSTYIIRMHDCLENKALSYEGSYKQAAVEACIIAFLKAQECQIPFWQEDFWRDRALGSLHIHAKNTSLRHQPGFEQALSQLQHNIAAFRQPRLPAVPQNSKTFSLPTPGRRFFQTILIPYAAALCPLVWGDTANVLMSLLWDSRLLSQMNYSLVLQTLEEQLGSEPENGEIDTAIGRILFRHVHTNVGNAAMTPWILEIQPKSGISNVRQAVISFVRKHNNDNAITVLRNTETKTLVLSRSSGIPQKQWKDLVEWLVNAEGCSDTEGNPGCWHVVKNTQGMPADFILNGNAAHRYVPPTQLTVDSLAQWVAEHPFR